MREYLQIIVNRVFFVSMLNCVLLCYSFNTYAHVNSRTEELARWSINYGHYLVEVGKYLEALEYYVAAFELSHNSNIIIDALTAKANLLALYLDSKEQALSVYRDIENNYPEKAQMALYRQGLLLFEMKHFHDSETKLQNYLNKYPEGTFWFQAEAILKKTRSKLVPPPYKIPVHPLVRIRLCHNVKSINISNESGSQICVKNRNCSRSFKVKSLNNKMLINGKIEYNQDVLFTCSSPVRIISMKYDKKVRGSIKILFKDGKLTAINIVDIETYLNSVVPSESYPTWPFETLKSQAIAARTYALYQIEHRKSWSFDMVDNEGDQAYKGIERENSKTTHAVKETAGMILMQNNRPILAMYSANSGGFTASAKAIFDLSNKSYLIAKKDSLSLKGKMAYWNRAFTTDQIESLLKKVGIYCYGINSIRANSLGPSGRVITVQIAYKGTYKLFKTRTTLKRALKLPEILFKIRKAGQSYYFEGNGYGHGVGYSQWGAAIMGETKKYDKILEFYYPNTDLVKKW